MLAEQKRSLTAEDIEIAVARHFGVRQNIIVPNVSWGIGLHECDLLILTKAGYLIEVEIKASKGDVARDRRKLHNHKSYKIKALYFAIPKELFRDDVICLIPQNAGIISVTMVSDKPQYRCSVEREPVPNEECVKLCCDEQFQVARLGAIRVWGLKAKLIRNRSEHSA